MLLDTPNAGFTLATPVGVALGSVFAVLSSLNLSGDRVASAMRWGRWLRAGLLTLMALWAAASVLRLPPLQARSMPEVADGILTALAIPAVLLYGIAAARYLRLWWERPSLMVLSMIAAFVLLGEAMIALVFAQNWALSWWEWHVLLLAAFVLVMVGVRIQWYEERFADLYLEDTVSGQPRVERAVRGPAGVHHVLGEPRARPRSRRCSTRTSRSSYLPSYGGMAATWTGSSGTR